MARTPRTPRTESTNNRSETTVNANEGEITFGIDWGTVSASISSKGILTLGIGIAEVSLNLKDPNESTLSYAFGLYTIEGERQGCTVILRYYIGGEITHIETRTVPECDEDNENNNNDDNNDEDNENDNKPPKVPPWMLYKNIKCVACVNSKQQSELVAYDVFLSGIYYKIWQESTVINVTFDSGSRFTITREQIGGLQRSPIIVTPGTDIQQLLEDSTQPESLTFVEKGRCESVDFQLTRIYSLLGSGSFGVLGVGYKINDLLSNFTSSSSDFTDPHPHYIYYGYYDENRNLIIIGIAKEITAYQRGRRKWKVFYDDPEPKIPPWFNQPPSAKRNNQMDDRCCRMLERIYVALDVDELLDKGFEVPNRWIATDAKGYQKLESYLKIIEFQLRMQDHLGIHPFTALVTDYNAAKEGNQELETKSVNATAFAKQVTELLLENKGDSATRLNLMIRTAIAVGQIFNMVAICTKRVREIMRFLNMPIQEKTFQVPMPFDFTFGKRKEAKKKGKGFAPEPNKKAIEFLNINTEEATETLLPVFMQDEKQPIIVEMFDDREPNLIERIKGDPKL